MGQQERGGVLVELVLVVAGGGGEPPPTHIGTDVVSGTNVDYTTVTLGTGGIDKRSRDPCATPHFVMSSGTTRSSSSSGVRRGGSPGAPRSTAAIRHRSTSR